MTDALRRRGWPLARLPRMTRSMWRWMIPHVVAAFIVFHVAASCVEAIPDLRMGLDRKVWKEPRVRHELDRWATRLGVPRDQMEELLFASGTWINDTRLMLRTPFGPYVKAIGLKQSWAMFVAGSRHRDRFQIRGRTCAPAEATCEWAILYFRNDDEHVFMKDTLENARVRSATFRWGWPPAKKSYGRGCDAIAARAFAARSDMFAVQCRFEKTTAPDPRPGAAPQEAPEFSRERLVLRR